MRIGIRLFDVIASFEPQFQEKRKELFPYVKHRDHHSEYPLEVLIGVFQSPRFFLNLPPVPGAVEAVKEILALGHKAYVFTTPFNRRGISHHEQVQSWLDQHFGDGFSSSESFLLVRDRGLLNVHVLINDDVPEQRAVPDPTWELVIFDNPLNQNISNVKRITSWEGDEWKRVLGI